MGGTIFLATSSEFETARAFGRSSPKNRVTVVKKAVTNPRLCMVHIVCIVCIVHIVYIVCIVYIVYIV